MSVGELQQMITFAHREYFETYGAHNVGAEPSGEGRRRTAPSGQAAVPTTFMACVSCTTFENQAVGL